MKTPWDRYNKTIAAINNVDLATQGETDEECLRLAEAAKEHLRGLAAHYFGLYVEENRTVTDGPKNAGARAGLTGFGDMGLFGGGGS